jgi:hypothetical protein
MRPRFRSLIALPLLAGGCAVHMQAAEGKIPEGAIPKLDVTTPVAIRPRIVGSAKHELPIAGANVTVDEVQFSSELANGVLEALRLQSAPVDPDAARSVELQVVRVALQPDRTIFCVIDFNRRLGDGRVRGLQSRSKDWNFQTACSDALAQAVVDTLNDPDTRSYLEAN